MKYIKGKVLTLREIKDLDEGTMIHATFWDEVGKLRYKMFGQLLKDDDDEEYAIQDGSYPFPVNGYYVKDKPDILYENLRVDGTGWTYTIREAIPERKVKIQKFLKDIE
jgi:hypothetical protein